ncbi:hypothetical protein CC85DRAFT_281941 [Cutaneotrichosporon oleaginosum]|uniref:BRCT domain-containing protein n=1 Tax=Cutaneotrichosporon oleaginosum TaxID=879819 RepID=A0A0J0XZ03_9TREE|nr:uncharacterized protein CC85DRAFT_281941 [Cutaneotrichosporon oleaginosum]KLT46295.1 hypothetical protein CC85DRAFT_281941 [Cutaneotrichosporon oleaginosum]TXT10299.1 hypothetical protein COLE_04233 [Cutaneotrichosporon oleaginosum]
MPHHPPSSPDIVAISPPPSFPTRPPKRRRTSSVPSDPSAPPPAQPLASSSKASRKPSSSISSLRKKVSVTAPNSRARVTERMLNTLDSAKNPITHSDAFARTAHVQSCSTGHQQRGADRGFWASARSEGLSTAGVSESATYWSVRTAKVEAQGRAKTNSILAGCTIAINGHTGPVSNLQLQNLITSNGGRFAPHQHSGCTHVVAERLAGGKTQKIINGAGGRGASRRAKIVKVQWVLDSVAAGKRLSEAGYMVISDPSQNSLFTTLGVKPKAEMRVNVQKDEE